MAQDLHEVLEKAMALPNEARAALAGALLESLDETVDEIAEEQWAFEIALRVAEMQSGEAKVIPWPQTPGGVAEEEA